MMCEYFTSTSYKIEVTFEKKKNIFLFLTFFYIFLYIRSIEHVRFNDMFKIKFNNEHVTNCTALVD